MLRGEFRIRLNVLNLCIVKIKKYKLVLLNGPTCSQRLRSVIRATPRSVRVRTLQTVKVNPQIGTPDLSLALELLGWVLFNAQLMFLKSNCTCAPP